MFRRRNSESKPLFSAKKSSSVYGALNNEKAIHNNQLIAIFDKEGLDEITETFLKKEDKLNLGLSSKKMYSKYGNPVRFRYKTIYSNKCYDKCALLALLNYLLNGKCSSAKLSEKDYIFNVDTINREGRYPFFHAGHDCENHFDKILPNSNCFILCCCPVIYTVLLCSTTFWFFDFALVRSSAACCGFFAGTVKDVYHSQIQKIDIPAPERQIMS